MPICGAQELQALEDAAWASPELRALYSTRYVPGFPWHTVVDQKDLAASPTPPALARRHVIPYDFPFTVFVKGRWVGRRLLEVYAEELPHHTSAYYEACLRSGRLYCVQRGALGRHNTQRKLLKRGAAPGTTSAAAGPNMMSENKDQPSHSLKIDPESTHVGLRERTPAKVACSTLEMTMSAAEKLNVTLQHGDVVYHSVHRHEVPVTVGTSGFDPVYITAVRIHRYGLICVNKPTGLPTHATGRYMYNSLTALLEYVLAPKRLRAWLMAEDPLLQSLVSTAELSPAEKEELLSYYDEASELVAAEADQGEQGGDTANENVCSEVEPAKLPRPCHRLDKVTSGVLLLAVRQDAAKRIGTVLMQKAKEVDAAVSAELVKAKASEAENSCAHECNKDADGVLVSSGVASAESPSSSPEFPASLQRIVSRTYELQKYYLARVVGTLRDNAKAHLRPASPSAKRRTAWQLCGSEPCLQQHNSGVRNLLSSFASRQSPSNPPATFDKSQACTAADMSFPGGLLTVAPIEAHNHAAIIAADHQSGTDSNNAQEPQTGGGPSCQAASEIQKDETLRREKEQGASTSAATLCQSLGAVSLNVEACALSPRAEIPSPKLDIDVTNKQVESLVLCTPYTGRLHQIRYHLSALGCPIVGDVVYTPAAAVTAQKLEQSKENSSLIAKDASASRATESCSKWTRNEQEYIYFDAAQLPPSYRSFLQTLVETDYKESDADAARVGVKRDRTHDPDFTNLADASLLPAEVAAWQREPQCYECAGRLPIVATKECATGTSAICLHAWAYEVKESLLLSSHELDESTSQQPKANGAVTKTEDAAGARAIDGGVVRFEAPPPAWAHTTLLGCT